jgi:hypothetical protein
LKFAGEGFFLFFNGEMTGDLLRSTLAGFGTLSELILNSKLRLKAFKGQF